MRAVNGGGPLRSAGHRLATVTPRLPQRFGREAADLQHEVALLLRERVFEFFPRLRCSATAARRGAAAARDRAPRIAGCASAAMRKLRSLSSRRQKSRSGRDQKSASHIFLLEPRLERRGDADRAIRCGFHDGVGGGNVREIELLEETVERARSGDCGECGVKSSARCTSHSGNRICGGPPPRGQWSIS